MKQAELYELALERLGRNNMIYRATASTGELVRALSMVCQRGGAFRNTLALYIAKMEISLASLRVVFPGLEKDVQGYKRNLKRRLLKTIRRPDLIEDLTGGIDE